MKTKLKKLMREFNIFIGCVVFVCMLFGFMIFDIMVALLSSPLWWMVVAIFAMYKIVVLSGGATIPC